MFILNGVCAAEIGAALIKSIARQFELSVEIRDGESDDDDDDARTNLLHTFAHAHAHMIYDGHIHVVPAASATRRESVAASASALLSSIDRNAPPLAWCDY
jgi:hypothetical protein